MHDKPTNRWVMNLNSPLQIKANLQTLKSHPFTCNITWIPLQKLKTDQKEKFSKHRHVQYPQFIHSTPWGPVMSLLIQGSSSYFSHLFSSKVFMSLIPCSEATAITWSKALSRPKSFTTSLMCSLCKKNKQTINSLKTGKNYILLPYYKSLV